MIRCAQCSQENPPHAKFCLGCGARLEAPTGPSREVRKVVTIVFSDVTGSTDLGERLDPESLRHVMGRYFEEMRIALENHGGTVEKFIGDAVMAVFGIPILHEDDALRAVRAAEEMRERLTHLNGALRTEWGVELRTRTGVNTGEVVAGDPTTGQALVTGDAVNVAARLEQAAEPSQILLGAETFKLVRNAVEVDDVELLSVKGKELPIAAVPLRSVRPHGESRVSLESPMLGREEERTLLSHAFERSERERRCHLFTVLGSAGVGKSRLARDFLEGVRGRASVLIGRCLSYGDGNTFWPIQELVKEAAALDDDESPVDARRKVAQLLSGQEDGGTLAEMLEQAIGLAEPAAAMEDIYWAIRRLFESLAKDRPLVVVFEDIHWGEPAFLDLIEHIADWSQDAPILLLCIARPDLFDARPSWGGGKVNASTILLEPLGDTHANAMIDNLLHGSALDDETRERIIDAAGGNPLFVEEMIGMMVDEGLLIEVGQRWEPVEASPRIVVPPTIQAILAARLDLLDPEERIVVEAASVVGATFSSDAVRDLVPEPVRPRVSEHLMTLVRKELIRTDRTASVTNPLFRFRHILIRDAAYSSMPKEARALMHERLARWLTDDAGARLAEFEDIVAHHLEQAYRLNVELGVADERTEGLAREAIDTLLKVGDRTRARADVAATSLVLERAVSLMRDDDPRGPRIHRLLAVAQRQKGAFAEATATLERAAVLAERQGNEAETGYCALESADMTTSGGRKEWPDFAAAQADRWLPFFEERNDHVGLALGCSTMASVWLVRFRWMETLKWAERALEHSRRAEDRSVRSSMSHQIASAYLYGPIPVDQALEALARLEGTKDLDPALRMTVRMTRAPLLSMKREFDEARRLLAEARAYFEERGNSINLAGTGFLSAPVESYAGDMEAAAAEYRKSHEILLALDETGYRCTVDGFLAVVLAKLKRYEEAEHFALEARDITPDEEDISAQTSWRAAYGAVLASRGQFDDAIRFVDEAITVAETTDSLNEVAEIVLLQADVYEMAGDLDQALKSTERAVELYAAKGNVAAVGLTQPRLLSLQKSRT